jgi:transcriptional regulator PpsR
VNIENSTLSANAQRISNPFEIAGKLDARSAAALMTVAADITLVIDSDGIIRDKAFRGDDLSGETFSGWLGKPWIDTVTVESRPKIEQLLQAAGSSAPSRWRQVNHPTSGADLPVQYSAVQTGSNGQIVAVGRDMRMVASLQQRLIEAEQSIEQEYARLRSTETRYRLLLQVASEAILILDAKSGKVIESNPAAAALLHTSAKKLFGSVMSDLFGAHEGAAVEAQLAALRTSGRADDIAIRLGEGREQAIASSTLFRQDGLAYVLIRLSSLTAGANGVVIPKAQSKVLKIIDELPDGFVVTDQDRRILTANSAFLEIVQVASEEQVRGELIDRWLGRPGVDIVLIANRLTELGAIRQLPTILRGQYGTTEDVEISGVSVPDGDQPCFGFTIRRMARKAVETNKADRVLPRSVEQLTQLVGKVPLKELVRETTDIIERLCIEAALQLNENNRASTAEMLGLSRQSLYVKLNRYGIDDPAMQDAS